MFPGEVALVFGDEAITYAELERRVSTLRRLILDKVPGEKLIAVSCTRSIQTVVNILAALAADKAYLPIDFDLPADRIQKIVSETQLRFGLPGSVHESFDSVGITDISESLPSQTGLANERAEKAYILFTSGSTGVPKGIAIPHAAVTNFVEWQNSTSQSGPGFNTLQFAKLTFDVSVQEIFCTLSTGGTLFLAENSTLKDPLLLLEFVEKNAINRIFFPFIALQGLCNAANSYGIFPKSLKEIMTAGEQLKVSLAVRKFFGKMDCVLYNQYGPTETTVIITELRLDGNPDRWEDLPSIGKAIAGHELILVDETGKLVTDTGVVGEIYISGPGLALGYFNNAALTAEKFVKIGFEGLPQRCYFKTGDLAEWTSRGELRFKSRIDDQIKISGFRVELSDIEANVSNIEGIDENVVITDHYSDGEIFLKLFYISADSALTQEVIRRKLEKVLPEYMIPAQLIKVDLFPKTSSGKVDRKALAKSQVAGTSSKAESKLEETKDLEQIVRKIWVQVLGVDDFAADSNFFNLGGRSILAQKLSLEISEKLGMRFPVAFAYQYPTLKSQLSYLTEASKQSSEAGKIQQHQSSRQSKDVAVIAMAGKFPKANSIEEFWKMIKSKGEGITFFDKDEIDPLIRAEAEEPNYVKARGIVDGVENFDAEYFGINPKLAAIMDPQQRLFMEICHEALEKAGWIANRPEYKIGVFGGTNYNTYFNKNIVFDQELLDVFGAIPILSMNEKDYLTSRTAFQLNLKGPAVSVYSACSTSLLAVAQAVESIRSGQCVAALAGGASVTFPVRSGQVHEEGAIFSHDGHCKPFDASGTGTVFCDGAGVVLLKSYEQAVADGDPIFAVVKGVAVNNDGSEKASFTSPSVLGQADVIKTAMADAGVRASDIGMIEAHGTATPIGDPIEIEGLKLAFGEAAPLQSCSISSVKSNVGHLTAAAGIAGLIKAICALNERVLPASRGYERPNPEINFEQSPFYVQKDTAPWMTDGKRVAGVSSFGFGGTNVHVIVEEFDSAETKKKTSDYSDHLISFSAKTEKSLALYAADLRRWVSSRSDLDLASLSQNLLKRNAPFGFQQSFCVSSKRELLDKLQAVADGETRAIQRLGEFGRPVFLFPGQGAQYIEMGKTLYESNKVFKTAFDECCGEFDSYLPTSLKQEIFSGSAETLANTLYTQPAIFTVCYSLSLMLMDMGIQPEAVCGHSIGEYVAAHFAGVFFLQDAIKVVAYRGKLISELPGGNMLSVRSKTDIVLELLPQQLSLAAHNSPNLCVVSGPVSAIADFKAVLDGYGIASQILKTSHAFHSAMMDGALEDFAKVIASVKLQSPKLPLMSTQTGKWLTDQEAKSVDYWTGHIRSAVLFNDAAATLLEEMPDAYFVEVGPGNVLNSLMQQQPNGKKHPIVHSLSRTDSGLESAYMIEQLGIARAKGALIDLDLIFKFSDFEFLDIPTYAFDKKLCWNQNGANFNPAFRKSAGQSLGNRVEEAPLSSGKFAKEEGNGELRHFAKLKTMLESASGISISENDLDSSFFELGLDSLILTQFTFSLKKEFGVQVSFRQLNDTHNTPKSILDLLDESLSPEEKANKAQSAPKVRTVEVEDIVNASDLTRETSQEEGDLSAIKLQNFNKIKALLEAAAGVSISEENLDSSFFELGLDSLILTQFVFSLKKEFGVQVSFKQLNDSLNTPKSILDYLEANRPSDAMLSQENRKGFPSGEASMHHLKNQLESITQQVRKIETGHSEEHASQMGLDLGRLTSGMAEGSATGQGASPVAETSQKAADFLADFGLEFTRKTMKSKQHSLRMNGGLGNPSFVNGYPAIDSSDVSYKIVSDRFAGATMHDVDGNRYLDWMGGKGVNILGNNPSLVGEALKKHITMAGDSGSIASQVEALGKTIRSLAGVEQFALYATEYEAKQCAFSLAQNVSDRKVLVTFSKSCQDCDRSGSAVDTADSKGELVLEYGSQQALETISKRASQIAAVWFSPIQKNNPGFVSLDFLKRLRALTASLGICLIMDETLTGFRVHPGGFQQLVGVTGDLTVYGTMENSGLQLTILGGKAKWFGLIGESSVKEGNGSESNALGFCGSQIRQPLPLAAAQAVLREIAEKSPEIQENLTGMTRRLVTGINDIFDRFGVAYRAFAFKSIWRIAAVSKFNHSDMLFAMLRSEGVNIHQRGFCYMTDVHWAGDIDLTLQKIESVLTKLIENEVIDGDLPDLEEVLMDIKNPPFPGAKIGFDENGNPMWIKPPKK